MTTLAVDSMFNTMQMLSRQREGDFDAKRKRKKAEWEDEDRGLKMEEVARAKQLRSDLEAAAKPLTVEDGVYQPTVDDDGNAMPANPAQFQVGGKFYADRASADRAANDPQAQVARMGDVLRRHAKPEAAMDLRTKQLTAEDAERKAAASAYMEDLKKSVPFGDWDAAASFMNRSGDPGVTGEIVVSPDGKKRVLMQIQSDGSKKAVGEFDNTAEGFLELALRLERAGADVIGRHLDRKQTRLDNKEYRDEQTKRWEEDRAERARQHNERMAAMAARAAGKGNGGNGADGDATEGQVNLSAIDTTVDNYLATKNDEGKVIAPAPADLRIAVRALAARLPEASLGDPEGAAMKAVQIYQDALKASGNDLAQAKQRVAIQMAAISSGDSAYQVQIGKGPAENVGNVPKPQAGAPAAAGLPADASPAMRELAARAAAEREARAKREAEQRAALDAEKAQVRGSITVEQIKAMAPDEALRLLNSAAGRSLEPEVRALLRTQARGAKLTTGRGFGG